MYSKFEISKYLFFDIETVSEFATLQELRERFPNKAKLWDKRTDYLRERYKELSSKTNDELYQSNAALHSEFSKIICISFGSYVPEIDTITFKTFKCDNEQQLLVATNGLIDRYCKAVEGAFLIGHNVKRFDIPVICKRSIINNVTIPSILEIHDKKPWDTKILDTAELWAHGAWQEGFTGLELLCEVLNVKSPKEETHANQVQSIYWTPIVNINDERGLDRISRYCGNDVIATINCLLRMSGHPVASQVKGEEIEAFHT